MLIMVASLLFACSSGKKDLSEVQTKAQEITAETKNSVIAVSNSNVQLTSVTIPSQVVTDSKTQISIGLTGFEGNVYDFEEIDILGEFVDANDNVTTVPAFWYRGYDLDFEPYDLSKEYALEDWHGNAVGVFDSGDKDNAGRGVVRFCKGHTQYICQTSVRMPNEPLSNRVYLSIKRADELAIDGYYIGLYSDSTGKGASYRLDPATLSGDWTRISISFDDFEADEGATLGEMTALKIFALEGEVPQGALLIKDFGIERAENRFSTMVTNYC